MRVRRIPPLPPARFVLAHPWRAAVYIGRWRESRLAHEYLGGMRGVEIGGSAQNAFNLDTVNVDYLGSLDTGFKREELRVCGRALPVDVVASGDALPFADDSYDFVLASHVIEHFPDPIAALREWARVARRVFLIVPHPDRTFDRGRPPTPLAELVERNERGVAMNAGPGPGGHWSVWTPASFLELCDYLGWRVVAVQDPDDKVGNGFAIVADVR